MSSVQSFAESIVWNAKNVIVPLTIAIPAALVAIKAIRYLYENFSAIPEKLRQAKNFLVESFTQRPEEADGEFRKRALKNLLIGFACTTLFAGLFTACAFCPFLVLPSYLAIPAAISGICAVGDLLVNGSSYCEKIKAKAMQAKEFLKDAFTARPDETSKEARLRIAKNVFLAVIGAAIVGGAIAAAAYGCYFVIHFALSQNVGIWNPYALIPFQTPLVVFLEYALVGVLHGLLAIKNLMAGDKAGAAFHFSNFVLSFVFPVYYLLNATAADPMRLHHSFIGLSLSLLPFNTIKAIGTTMTLDSALYFFSASRGYFSGQGFVQYDFQNLFLDNLTKYLPALGVLCGAEYAIDRILPKQVAQEKAKNPQAAAPLVQNKELPVGKKRSHIPQPIFRSGDTRLSSKKRKPFPLMQEWAQPQKTRKSANKHGSQLKARQF